MSGKIGLVLAYSRAGGRDQIWPHASWLFSLPACRLILEVFQGLSFGFVAWTCSPGPFFQNFRPKPQYGSPLLFITRVELKNIKNHAESLFRFQPGVIAICGPNGSGKTTILEAIAWTLFDHLDYKRDDFVRRGTRRGQATVAFVSDLDGREYEVTRDTAGGYFVFDPVTRVRLVEQKNQVLPWLRQRLGVEPGTDLAALFRTTLGVPQGAFTYDFTLPPSNRKAIFDQILRVEEYRQAADGLRIPQRLAESRVVEADRQISRYEGELAAWDETCLQQAQVCTQLEAQAVDLAAAQVDRERLAVELEQLDQRRQAIEREQQVVAESRLRVEAIGESLQAARLAFRQAEEAAAIVAAASGGWQRYLEAARRLAELERQRVERDRQREELARQEHRLIEAESRSRRAAERRHEVEMARREAAPLPALIERQREIEAEISRRREARGEALGLRSMREDLQQELVRLRDRYQKLTIQIEAAEEGRGAAQSVARLEEELRRLEEESRRRSLLRQAHELKSRELERLRVELESRQAEQARVEQELRQLEEHGERVGSIPDLEKRLQELTETLARQRAELVRDQQMIAGLETGGLCPLLTERCLNLGAGESPGQRFREGLEQRQADILRGEAELADLSAGLGDLRRLALDYGRIPALTRTLATVADGWQALASRGEDLRLELRAIDDELRQLNGPAGGPTDEADPVRTRLEEELRAARQAQVYLHQAEVLLEERKQVQREGEVRRAESDRVDARLQELGDIDAQLADLQQVLRDLNDPRGRLLALTQTLEREPEWEREAVSAHQILDEARQVVEDLRHSLRIHDSLDAELNAIGLTRAQTEADYLAYIAHEQMAGTLAGRQTEAATLAVEFDRLRQAEETARAALALLVDGYDPERHRRLRLEYDRAREQVTELTTRQDHLREQLDSLTGRIASLVSLREEMQALARERERIERLGAQTEMIRDLLVRAAPFITESYLFSISHEANQLYREITGRYDVTLRWTRDYEITLEEDGHDRPFLNLSGGEQMAAALAVRLAMLRELSEIDLAFFDEPTTNMDEERRRNLALQLGRISDFNQLFVISHDDSFEGFTDQQLNLGHPS